jgi:L-rhamnose mutarotase
MKTHTSGVAILLATFLIGGLIGFGCSQAENKSKAQAQAEKTEKSKAEPSKADEPKTEMIEVDETDVEVVKDEAPKAEAPKPEAVKAETPKAETPKAAKKIQRFGSVIGLKAEKKDYYNKLHAQPWPEINAMIKKCNIQRYSIYEVELEGKLYLFSYFEYTGDDFKADSAKMAADPKTKEWWAETDPCQIRLPGTPNGEQWLKIPEVYHLD